MPAMQPDDIAIVALVGEVRFDPAGRQVAYPVTTVDRPANRYRTRIWLAPVDGSGPPRPVTAGDGADTLPRWSPDGGTIAFVSSRGDEAGSGIWVLPVGHPGEATRVCAWPDSIGELSWSPLGDRLAFVGRNPDPDQYGAPGEKRAAAEGPPRRVTRLYSRLNGEDWTFDRPEQLFVVPIDGSSPPWPAVEGRAPTTSHAWSPDGTRLAFVSARHDDWDLDLSNDIWTVESATTGAPDRLTDTTSAWSDLAWSPDGTRLAFLETPTPLDGPRHTRLGVVDIASGERLSLAVEKDRNAAPFSGSRPPVWSGGGDELLFLLEDEGTAHVHRVPAAGGPVDLVVGGRRIVRSFDATADAIVVAASAPFEPAEVFVCTAEVQERRLTNLSATVAARLTLSAPERFVATSADGTEVECWAMPPVGVEPGRRSPTILNIHGGPFTSYGWGWFDEFQLQVGAGFGVVYCNPRGSSGYSEAWGRAVRWPEAPNDPGSGWGGVDYDDVMACTDEAVRRFDWIDGDRLGVQGGSYGGYLTSWIVGHTDRFVAACSERAANNLVTLEYESDISGSFTEYVGVDHVRRPDLYERQSPSRFVSEMRTPMLLVHSENDLRCPIGQAEELFVALRLLGREPELVRFPGENHELSRTGSPNHRIQRAEIILEWFTRHLHPDPAH